MQVKVIIDEYKDTEIGRKVKRDEVIDVSQGHRDHLVSIGYAEDESSNYAPRSNRERRNYGTKNSTDTE